MNTQITQITTSVMTKSEAQEAHAQILELSGKYIDTVGPIALEMREREGWRALGFKNWTDYCQRVDKEITAVHVMRLAQKAEVERNVKGRLRVRHALVLARLPSAEAQREVYQSVTNQFQKPVEQNYETCVDSWFREHDYDSRTSASMGKRDDSDGWTSADLEGDSELAEALNRIEEVYSLGDRKAIQDGTIGLSRKDIIALAGFHASKMREVQYLIMTNHWDVARAMKFVNESLGQEDKVGTLINHCIGTVGLYYTCSVDGYDIQIKACPALSTKIKALGSKAKGQSLPVSVSDLGPIF